MDIEHETDDVTRAILSKPADRWPGRRRARRGRKRALGKHHREGDRPDDRVATDRFRAGVLADDRNPVDFPAPQSREALEGVPLGADRAAASYLLLRPLLL